MRILRGVSAAKQLVPCLCLSLRFSADCAVCLCRPFADEALLRSQSVAELLSGPRLGLAGVAGHGEEAAAAALLADEEAAAANELAADGEYLRGAHCGTS